MKKTPEELRKEGEALIQAGEAKIAAAKQAQLETLQQENAAAQEAHEAALISYQTERKDGMNLARHELPMAEEKFDALLKDEKTKDE